MAFRWDDEKRAQLQDMWTRRELPLANIARHFGLTVCAIQAESTKMRQNGWKVTRRQGGTIDGAAVTPYYEETPEQMRAATIGHLQDILKEHGYEKRWESYSVPTERSVFVSPFRPAYSLTGSSALAAADCGSLER